MKIFTKVVWQWVDDKLVRVEEHSHDYDGPVALAKGGGSSAQEVPQELKDLYKFQREQGEYLMGQFRENVAPAYRGWLGESQGYGSQANQELQGQRAEAGQAAAGDRSIMQLSDELKSYGINPADSRYASQMGQMGIANAGNIAGAGTAAREGVRNKGFAMQQDAIGMGMGTPTQATSALNSAANTATASWQGQQAAQQMQSNSIGNIARLGTNMAGIYMGGGNSGTSYFGADGGYVRLKGGGYVQRQKLAGGGMAGGGGPFMRTPTAPPMPMGGGQPQQSPAGAAVQGATQGLGPFGLSKGIGHGVEAVGRGMESNAVQSFGAGMRLGPNGAAPAIEAYKAAATQAVDSALPAVASGEATGAAADVIASSAAEQAAQQAALQAAAQGGTEAAALAAGETAAGLTAGATLGAAIPVIGGGLALYGIGDAAGWWADGGKVTPNSDGTEGGEVDGPGGPKDDEVPAMLSDGEFVMPVGAVKFFGLDRMEKMRQKGLEYEKKLGIAHE